MQRACFLLVILAATSYGMAGALTMQEASQMGKETVTESIQKTEEYRNNPNRTLGPADLFRNLRHPAGTAADQSAAAETLEQAIAQLDSVGISYGDLTEEDRAELLELAGCLDEREGNTYCSDAFHDKYRTADGTCNHRNDPLKGASFRPFTRLKAATYENGINKPRGWNLTLTYNGYHLPSPRSVSLKLLSTKNFTEDKKFSEMIMQWGQFLDHDLTLSPEVVSTMDFEHHESCEETCENEFPCFPIPTPPDDTRIPLDKCMGTVRSAGTCSIDPNESYQRQQFNSLTSYLDASNVYGSTQNFSERLRGDNGYLKVGPQFEGGKPWLPYDLDNDECMQDPDGEVDDEVPCFLGGDTRLNEQAGLLSMHTIWVREHNRLVDELRGVMPDADDETLYQEARKIVGAVHQIITYKHWLPKIVGPQVESALEEYKGYDPDTDPSILNEFATACFRFGHGTIRPFLHRLDENFEEIPEGHLELHKAFFTPWRVVREGGVDPLLRGLYAIPAKQMRPRNIMTEQLTEFLFALSNEIAFDLGALNVQRGRDHGLPSYNDMREHCGIRRAKKWRHLRREIPQHAIDKLKDLYGHVDNIDLWAGGMAERGYKGGRVGRTFRCVLIKQFKALRNGDRFWYENDGVFTKAQIKELEKTSLARVLCDNGDYITRIQKDAFSVADYDDMEPCNKIPGINIKKWRSNGGQGYP